MRGLSLEPNMIASGAVFVEEASTTPDYRLWSISDDEHPAMQWFPDEIEENRGMQRCSVALELWKVRTRRVGRCIYARYVWYFLLLLLSSFL